MAEYFEHGSGIYRHVVRRETDFSEEHTAFNFRVEKQDRRPDELSCTIRGMDFID
jgi:hypothetical protein